MKYIHKGVAHCVPRDENAYYHCDVALLSTHYFIEPMLIEIPLIVGVGKNNSTSSRTLKEKYAINQESYNTQQKIKNNSQLKIECTP